jgi:hypothetical protein
VPRSRAVVPCLPAVGVFLEGDSARVINPPTGGGLGGNNTAESRTPTTWPGSCGSGAPRPGWSRTRALLDIYLSHNERHQSDCSHYICSSKPLPGSAPAWVKAPPRCPTHRLRGAVTMGSTGIPLVSRTPGASEDISPLLPQGASGRAW